jgi:hypothetical protein
MNADYKPGFRVDETTAKQLALTTEAFFSRIRDLLA